MRRKTAYIQLLSIACVAVVWEFTARAINVPAVFPTLGELCRETIRLFTEADFYRAVGASIARGAAGMAAACILAFMLGTTAAFSHTTETALRPLVVGLRSVPVISFVLLAMLWFSGEVLPVVVALVTVLPLLYQTTVTALRQTDRRLVEMAHAFGKTSLQRFLYIYIYSARDLLFDGMTTAVGFGWRAIIIGEALAQPLHGIGSGMKEAQSFIQVPRLMAWTVVAIAVSYLFELLLQQARRWRHTRRRWPAPQPLAQPAPLQDTPVKRLHTTGLHKQFSTQVLFDGCDLTFDNRAITLIKAPSGRGKTTLLRMIAGLDTDYTGIITRPHDASLAYAFQDVRLLPWLSVRDNIAYALAPHPRTRQTDADLIGYLLTRLHLSGQADQYPHQLSGGQQQRAGLARALAARADILLLDEPLSGLDEALKTEIIDFIFAWTATYHPVVLWVTHEDIRGREDAIRIINLPE